jgi:hypothetical protein
MRRGGEVEEEVELVEGCGQRMHLSGQRLSGVAPILVKRGLASREAEPDDNRRLPRYPRYALQSPKRNNNDNT